MKTAAICLLSLILVLFGYSANAGIQEPRGFENKIFGATFALYLHQKSEHTSQFICTATAFSKDSGGYFLISAGHCVDNEDSESVFAVAEQIDGPLHSVTPVKARFEGSEDIALFYLQSSKKYPVIGFGDEATERVGDFEINTNFTQGLAKQLAYGRVASGPMVSSSSECGDLCGGQFIVHEDAGPGASGSAVISERTHKIVGIAVTSLGSAEGIGVEPISAVKKALTESDQYKQLHQTHDDDDAQ